MIFNNWKNNWRIPSIFHTAHSSRGSGRIEDACGGSPAASLLFFVGWSSNYSFIIRSSFVHYSFRWSWGVLGRSWGGPGEVRVFQFRTEGRPLQMNRMRGNFSGSHVCVVKCLCLLDGFRITMRRSISQTLYVAMKLSLGALGKFFRGRIVLVSIFQTFYVAMKLSLRALGNLFNDKYSGIFNE